MRYFLLKDMMSREGDVYQVTDDGEAGMDDGTGGWIPAFVESAKHCKTTQLFQLQDYASKYGSLEEIDYKPEGE